MTWYIWLIVVGAVSSLVGWLAWREATKRTEARWSSAVSSADARRGDIRATLEDTAYLRGVQAERSRARGVRSKASTAAHERKRVNTRTGEVRPALHTTTVSGSVVIDRADTTTTNAPTPHITLTSELPEPNDGDETLG